MIFSSFFKALGQLGDPRFRKVLFLGIGLTFVLLIAAYAGLLGVIEWLTGETTSLPIVGEVTWVGDLLSFGSLFLMLFLSAFLMVPVASAITSMFLDEVDDKANPLGIKGVGELGIAGAGAAIANAIYNATGVRVRDYPITLDKHLEKLPAIA